MRLSEVHLEVPNVVVLVRGVHPCGSGFAGLVRWVSWKVAQPSGGPGWVGAGGVCGIEQLTEEVGCFSLPAGGVVEPAAGAPEVVRHLLRRRLRPRLRCRGCNAGCWEVRVKVAVVEVEAEEDVAGGHVQAAPAVAYGWAVGG